MSRPAIIAVFGISGVGKSTLIDQVTNTKPNLAVSANAGVLIRQGRPDAIKKKSLRKLPSDEISRNQLFLIKELQRFSAKVNHPVILLDGHCIIDNGHELVPISSNIIARLELSAIVFVWESVDTIIRRRSDDPSRERPLLSAHETAQHQKFALDTCLRYEKELGIPVVVFSASSIDALITLLIDLTQKNNE